MLSSHAIQALRLDVQAGPGARARQLPERLSAACGQWLPRLLAEELSRHCPPEIHLHLPQLTLHLPPIADHRLETDLPDLIREALREALRELPPPAAAAPSVNSPAAALQVLEYFLLHGRLPWHVNRTGFSLQTVFQAAFTRHAAAFRQLVLRLGRATSVRQRLVWQLSAEELEQLIMLLEPAQAPFLREYLLTTLAAHRRQRLAPITEPALRTVLHELMLADLLAHSGSAFNRRTFVERQIRQLAARYNVSFGQLLHQLAEVRVALPFSVQSALPALIRSLYEVAVIRPATAIGSRIFSVDKTSTFRANGSTDEVSAVAAGTSRTWRLVPAQPPALSRPPGFAAPAGTADSRWTARLTSAEAARPAPSAGAAARKALPYFLRHAALLPPHASLTRAQLEAALAGLMGRGWGAVWPLLQQAGPPAARCLAQHFSEALLRQLFQQATAGQTRAFAGILTEVRQTYAALAGFRLPGRVLWEYAFRYVLSRAFRPLSGPAFRQWLNRQLTSGTTDPAQPLLAGMVAASYAAPVMLVTSGTPLRARTDQPHSSPSALVLPPLSRKQHQELMQHLLLGGNKPAGWPAGSSLVPDLVLRQVLSGNPLLAWQWLRRQPLTVSLLLQLLSVADEALLHLITGPQRPDSRRLQSSRPPLALRRLLAGSAGLSTTGAFPGFLGAAYLAVRLARSASPISSLLEQLARHYRLPWRALLRKMEALVWQQPELRQWPVIAALLKAHRQAVAHDFPPPSPAQFPHAATALRSLQTGTAGQMSAGSRLLSTGPDAFARVASGAAGWFMAERGRPSANSSAAAAEPAAALLASSVFPPTYSATSATNTAQTESQAGVAAARISAARHTAATPLALPAIHRPAGPQAESPTTQQKPAKQQPGNAQTSLHQQDSSGQFTERNGLDGLTQPPASGPAGVARPGRRPAARHFTGTRTGWAAGVPAAAAGYWPTRVFLPHGSPGAGTGRPIRPRLQPAQLQALQLKAGRREVVWQYLRTGARPAWWPAAVPVNELSRWLEQLGRQHPQVVRDFLRRESSPAVGQRVAVLADLSWLGRLLVQRPGRPFRAAPALAALDPSAANGGPTPPPRWLLFLRAAYLTFHLLARHQTAANRRRSVQQLAATYGLPWQATQVKLCQLLARHPLLLTDAFFAGFAPIDTLARKGSSPSASVRATARTQALRPAPGTGGSAAASVGRPTSGTASSTSSATTELSYDAPTRFGPTSTPAPTAVRLTQLPTGAAARDLVFHLLLHQQLPWWAPAGVSESQRRLLLHQVAHYYRRELQVLVRAHGQGAGFRKILTQLAGFTLLAQLVPAAGHPGSASASLPALKRLDQLLSRASLAATASLLVIKAVFLTQIIQSGPSSAEVVVRETRRAAAAAGLAWGAVLECVTSLWQQVPGLAQVPFFAALLDAHTTRKLLIRQPPVATRRQRATAPTPTDTAALPAYQRLAHYLHTGQIPALTARPDRLPKTAQPPAAPSAPHPTSSATDSLLEPLLQTNNRPLLQQLRPLLALATVRTRLLNGLSEKTFWQLLRHLYPVHYRLAAPLVADWQLLARQGIVRLSAPALFEVLLALVQATPAASWRPARLLQGLLAAEEKLWPRQPAAVARPALVVREIARRGLVLRSPLAALLTLQTPTAAVRKVPAPSTPIPFLTAEERPLETVYIQNAGLVLLWPFLTMLFERLGYLENQAFRSEATRQQAALLLQFMAAGTTEVPEYELPLNKLLCGAAQPQPLPRELHLTTAEKDLAESLLKAVIARWEILKTTSVAGLRETFLLRPGKLEWLPERITLTVETKTLDILLDSRPWSISIIKLPWMPDPLYVTWR